MSLSLPHWGCHIENGILRLPHWGSCVDAALLRHWSYLIEATTLRLPHMSTYWGSLRKPMLPHLLMRPHSSVLAVLATFLNSAQAVLSLAHLSPSLFSLIDAASFLWCSLMSSITWKPQLARHLASLLDEKVSLYFIWKYSPLVIRRTSWSRPPYGRPLPASSCRGLACFAHKIARFAHRFARSARNTIEEYK